MFKRRELIQLFRDRTAVMLLGSFLFLALLLVLLTILNIRISDVQIPDRYSGYGLTNIYRDKWYTLLAFLAFGLAVAGMNGYLVVKLHSVRRGLSLGLAVLSNCVMIIGLIVAIAVFRLAAVSL